MATMKCSECQAKFYYYKIINQKDSLPPLKLEDNQLTKCTFCDTRLYPEHAKRAKHYGNYYRSTNCYMCNQCCWFEIGQ